MAPAFVTTYTPVIWRLRICWRSRRQRLTPPKSSTSVLATGQLGWKPQYTNIEDTIATAWAWHQANPNGYNDK